ncbi:hypothetical protein [Pseudomonas pseudonitroreducens]|uniref:hypothetical protein n=1 Tax=Pseudomonas pseudonitroreducens TaxID=2892326 RepID=UPI001F34FDDC|nr:hypothetical protein [Pseudomonas pseudonitroreducens]
MSETLLIGNNLALLVAALQLAERGRPVRLLLDGKPAGGHFAGMRLDGQGFDIGMVLFEHDSRVPQSADVQGYDPARRNDCARFTALAGDYLERFVATLEVPTPQVHSGGARHPDFIMANRLERFADWPEAGKVLDELAQVDSHHPLHAAGKITHPAYDRASYAEASLVNHGATLHRQVFEPLCEKILGVPSAQILARYHRLGWLPLYYPQTLSKAFAGEDHGLPEYRFRAAREGYSGALVEGLLEALQASGVSIDAAPLEGLERTPEGLVARLAGQSMAADRVALGVAPQRAAELLGQPAAEPPPAASVSLVLGRVAREHLPQKTTCLLVADAQFALFRVTDHDAVAGLDPQWHRVSLECNPDYFSRRYPAADAGHPLPQLLGELAELGVIRHPDDFVVLRHLQARNALALPNAAAQEVCASLQRAIAGDARFALTGSLLGLGVASLNDQIIQGLKLAEQWS